MGLLLLNVIIRVIRFIRVVRVTTVVWVIRVIKVIRVTMVIKIFDPGAVVSWIITFYKCYRVISTDS